MDLLMPRNHRFAVSFVVALIVVGVVGLTLHSSASAGLGDKLGDARKLLARAINGKDSNAVSAAVQKFVSIGGKKSISTLVKILPSVPHSEDGIYWSLIEGACSYVDREAMEYLGGIIVKGSKGGLSRDLLYGLSKNRSKYTLWALTPILEKGPRDLQILAVQKIGKIPIRKSVDVLIATMIVVGEKTAAAQRFG